VLFNNRGKVVINDLIASISPDIFMVQEHWLTLDGLYKLNDISENYVVFGSSAMNTCINSGPLVGRPFGGTAILINKKHVQNLAYITSGERYTVIKLYNWLFINIYMPCAGTLQRDLLYCDLLSELQSVIHSHAECN
jgi:hypothetical protein